MPAPQVLRQIRMTAQQRAVLGLLRRSDRFRGAQQLHLDLRQRYGVRIGLVTVYRILHAFADMKIAYLSTSRRDTAPRHRDRIDGPLPCIAPP